MSKPDNYDPPDHERVYFTSKKYGEAGYLVRRDGVEVIRLDRPNQELIKPFGKDTDWEPMHAERRYLRMQIIRVAFEADRALCRLLGYFPESKREWEALRDHERIEFMEAGPPKTSHPRRRRLWRAIMGELGGLEQANAKA